MKKHFSSDKLTVHMYNSRAEMGAAAADIAAAKANAVRQTVYGPISEACPASILRRHPGSHLFLDPESGALL